MTYIDISVLLQAKFDPVQLFFFKKKSVSVEYAPMVLNLISIQIIATVCMFLAGKVEETPRPLKDVIVVSYELIHKKDPNAVQRIKQQKVMD